MMRKNGPLRALLALLVAGAVTFVSLYAGRILPDWEGGFLPDSFLTHSLMLLLSLALARIFSKGRLSLFGLTRGTYRFSPKILLWALPTAVFSVLSTLGPEAGGEGGVVGDLSRPQIILFVWIYASVCEEVLTRGLLQTLLYQEGKPAEGTRRLSGPVILSGLFFGAMHLVLVSSMGPAAAPVIVLATLLGLLAGSYRQKTGSLIPAVLVHMLFNIGGMLPLWIIASARGG